MDTSLYSQLDNVLIVIWIPISDHLFQTSKTIDSDSMALTHLRQ